jgi:hypothetical protein
MMRVNQFDWTTIHWADAVFLQRPSMPQHVQICEMVKASRVPLWLDYDDDLFSVPVHNCTYEMYGLKSTQEQIAKCINMADVVTVTNAHLRERLLPLNKNIVVIPNAFEDERFDDRPPRKAEREKLVFWRGSKTHEKDLMQVCQQIVQLSHDPELADWFFHFMGYNPWWMTEQMRHDHTLCLQPIDVVAYHDFICSLQPPIWIVPLVDDRFNRSKSNIAWIEGSYAGATIIAPNIPEFQRPGVLLYDKPEEFGPTLRRAMKGEYNLSELSEKGWNAVRNTVSLSIVNKLRVQVLERLLARPRGYRSEVVSEKEVDRGLQAVSGDAGG